MRTQTSHNVHLPEEGICCFMPDGEFTRCACIWGFKCNPDKVTNDMCADERCFSNCSMGLEFIAVIVAALVLIVALIVLVLCMCCHPKD